MTGQLISEIEVALPHHTYPVYVGRNILQDLGEIARSAVGEHKVCVVADSHLAELHAKSCIDALALAGLEASLVSFPAGEAHKNMNTLSQLLEGIAETSLTRDDCICALGGGVTGDMAGLAAALYLRGIKLIQIPTSLLSMVDSSVGGKTAVDLKAGKNLAGAFFQPEAVLVDVELLRSMPRELFQDGCGEVIKHGMIADASLFEQLAKNPLSQDSYDFDELAQIIARNIEIKRDVVVQDEREGGLRQILNFGHTIGHAVEAASNFELGHGACVCIGMCAITRASVAKGWCDASVAERLETCISAFGLPTDASTDHELVMSFMEHDKKRHDDSFNVVIPEQIGKVCIQSVSRKEMRELVDLGLGLSGSKA